MPSPIRISGVAALAPQGALGQWMQNLEQIVNKLGQGHASSQYTPATGFAQTIPPQTGLCLLTPAGPLATGTITLPATAVDGFEQNIVSSQTVTTLTIAPNSGQTISGATSFTLTANVKVCYRWVAARTQWVKVL